MQRPGSRAAGHAARCVAATLLAGGLVVATARAAAASQRNVRPLERALERLTMRDPKALHRQDRRRAILEIYSRLGAQPIWFEDGRPTPAAAAAALALADVATRGLDPADSDGGAWPAHAAELLANAPLSESAAANADVALTRDIVHVASDLLRGRIDPADVGAGYALPPDDTDLAGVIVDMARTGLVAEGLDALEPDYEPYRRLRAALGACRSRAAEWGDGPPIDPGDTTLRPGDSSPALARIARLLASLGDLAPEDESLAAANPYGAVLEAAVRRFQERHGLAVDGAIGHETRDEMRVPQSRRVRQVELTLERWRWLPRRFTEPLVLVNVPSFRLVAIDPASGSHEPVLAMKVILGREYPGRRTPLIASRLNAVVFSPWWELPARIAREEVLPALLRDPDRAAREGYVIVRAGREIPLDDEAATLVRDGLARMRQRPGPGNVLGGARFMFPNDFSTYAHGTSEPGLFERANRALSHGCIRVEDPAALAAHVLRHDPAWTPEAIATAMASGEQSVVPLPGRDWIVVVHGTASVADDGTMSFFRDVYRQDSRLEAALAGTAAP